MQYFNHNLFKAALLLVVFQFGMMKLFGQTEKFNAVKGMTIGPNYVVFEAEATTSPLGKWQIVKPGDSRYLDHKTVPPVGETHLEFTGNNPSVGNPNSPLEYQFMCPKTGTYRLGARLYQRLLGLPDDKCNDVYVKMAGDFSSGNTIPTSELQHNLKFYGRGVDKWGALYSLESHNYGHAPAIYKMKEGEIYTLTVSGRAQRTNIDYWLLYETSLPITLKAHKDLAAVNDEKYRPIISSCNTFHAVDMIFTGIEGFSDAETDTIAGMDVLQISEPLQWAAAQMIFDGTDGDAGFTLNTLLEKDGESSYRLRINGELIGEVTNPRIYDSQIEDYSLQSHLMNETDFHLQNGDTIQIEFNNTSNGLVPEGTETATARGRWLYLEICTTGSFAEYSIQINPQSVSLLLQDAVYLGIEKMLPYGADTTVLYTSEHPNIASVDQQGKLIALAVGNTTITASVMNDKFTAKCNVRITQSRPYKGKAATIPGLIEAEDYDIGGEGLAYHDKDSVNSGRLYRPGEGVDLQYAPSGAYAIFSVVEGEWLMYSIHVAKTGNYYLQLNVASIQNKRKLHFEIDGENVSGNISFDSTGTGLDFKTVIVENIYLTQGQHALKLVCDTGDFSINWFGMYEMGTIIPVSYITLTPRAFYLEAGKTKPCTVTLLPANASNQNITWSSSDEKIAKVNEHGVVEGVSQGETFIKIVAGDGAFTDSAKVFVAGNTGVKKLENSIGIYPNPFENVLEIKNTSGSQINEVSFLNFTGQCVYKKVLDDVYSEQISIPLNYHEVPRGIYFLHLKGKQLYKTIKIQRK